MKYLAPACVCLLIACQSPKSGPSSPSERAPDSVRAAAALATPDTTTLGGSWFLQPLLPSDTATGKTPILQLDLTKSRFTGNTGCNTMRGVFWFSQKDSSLSFSDKIDLSKMACPGYNEPAFMKSLRSAGHYRLREGVLTLLGDDRSELSRWTRKPANPPKTLRT